MKRVVSEVTESETSTTSCIESSTKAAARESALSNVPKTASTPRSLKTSAKWMLQRIRGILSNLEDFIENEGKTFRNQVSSKDVAEIKLARIFFHLCSVLPALTYYTYTGHSDRPAKFPASISYTIRKGTPQRVELVLWLAGWACMGRVLKRSATRMVKAFATQMWWTGYCTTVLFPLGRSVLSDAFHFFGAGMYMVDHVVLMRILNMDKFYRRIFWTSFVSLLLSVHKVHKLEAVFQLPSESGSSRERRRRLARRTPDERRRLFWWELLLMVSENMLFAGFVQGMPSGMVERKHIMRKNETCDTDEDDTASQGHADIASNTTN